MTILTTRKVLLAAAFCLLLSSQATPQHSKDEIFKHVKYKEPVATLDGRMLQAFNAAKLKHIDAYKGRCNLAECDVAFYDHGPYYGITFYPKVAPGKRGGLGQANGPELQYIVDKKTMKVVLVLAAG